MPDILLRIGSNIKAFRIKKGLSQESLARLLRADKAYVSRVEGGKKNLTLISLEKIAVALQTDIRKLFK